MTTSRSTCHCRVPLVTIRWRDDFLRHINSKTRFKMLAIVGRKGLLNGITDSIEHQTWPVSPFAAVHSVSRYTLLSSDASALVTPRVTPDVDGAFVPVLLLRLPLSCRFGVLIHPLLPLSLCPSVHFVYWHSFSISFSPCPFNFQLDC